MSSPLDFNALSKQAKRCVRRKAYAQAIEYFLQALELDDRAIDVHEGLAAAYFLSKNYEKAVEHFTRITRLDPSLGSALINLGAVYNRMGEHKKAVVVLRRGIQKDKKSTEGYYNMGIAHRHLDQMHMAASAYKEAIRIDPNMAEAHLNLANIYLDLKNNQQASMHYKKALEIRPNFERAERGLAQTVEAVSKAKASISPFGRLVDERTIPVTAPPRRGRELSVQQRFEDRQSVHEMAAEIHNLSKVCLAQFKDEIEPTLLALNRAVQGSEAPAVLLRTHAKFQTAIQNCEKLRRRFRGKVLELSEHEEHLNSPNSDAC